MTHSRTVLIPGSTGDYTCDDGYYLVGVRRRTCLSDGTWTQSGTIGSDPECLRECTKYWLLTLIQGNLPPIASNRTLGQDLLAVVRREVA